MGSECIQMEGFYWGSSVFCFFLPFFGWLVFYFHKTGDLFAKLLTLSTGYSEISFTQIITLGLCSLAEPRYIAERLKNSYIFNRLKLKSIAIQLTLNNYHVDNCQSNMLEVKVCLCDFTEAEKCY